MSEFTWEITDQIGCRMDGQTIFRDTADHWHDGLCRLLGIDDATARKWIESAGRHGGTSLRQFPLDDQIKILARAAREIFPPSIAAPPSLPATTGPCGHPANTIYSQGIVDDPRLCVIGCSACAHAWLNFPPATSYDRDYFEGQSHGVGYGNYLSQQPWRMEKSRRLLRQLRGAAQYAGVTLPASPRLLDVGSGYGFFRQAAHQAGWKHDGVEISPHACATAKELFHFDTQTGTLDDVAGSSYDLITLWDVIEHVPDTSPLFQRCAALLAPGGVCAIRTPNLHAVEREVFGRHYHSFKKEHLQYFSPSSITLSAANQGLDTRLVATQSNLLTGFSPANMRLAEMTLRGADIFAVMVRP